MRISTLELSNVFSFAEGQMLSLPQEGLVLVRGSVDGDEERSNGAGKTSFFEAISWILFDMVGKKVGKDRLIRTGETWCRGRIEFDNGLTITRQRGRSPLVKVEYEKIKSEKTNEAAKLIRELLGMDWALWSNAIYYPQGSLHEMISGTESTRQELLGNILGFKVFDVAQQKSKVHLRQYQDEEISLQARIQEMRNINSQQKENIEILRDRYVQLQKEWEVLPKADDGKLAALESKVSSLTKVLGQAEEEAALLEGKFNNIAQEAKEVMKSLQGDQCPVCLRPITQEIKDKVINTRKIIFTKAKNEYAEAKDKATKCKEETVRLGEQLNQLRNKAAELSVKKWEVEKKLKELEGAIKGISISSPKEDVTPKVVIVKKNIESYQLISDVFGRQIRRVQLNRFLPLYTQKVNRYLGLLASGQFSVAYDISTNSFIMENRGRTQPWGSFSGGERRLFNAVFSIALGAVLREERTSFSQVFFDELLSEMDTYYIKQALEFLVRLAKEEKLGIFLVTNHSIVVEEGEYAGTVECINEGGVTILRSE